LYRYYLPHFGAASDQGLGWILQRTQASTHSGRLFVTKLLSKAQAITDADEATPLLISEADREAIDLILSQLLAKKAQLEELDKSISEGITMEQDLADEIANAEMYHFNLTEWIITLSHNQECTAPTNSPAFSPTPTGASH